MMSKVVPYAWDAIRYHAFAVGDWWRSMLLSIKVLEQESVEDHV